MPWPTNWPACSPPTVPPCWNRSATGKPGPLYTSLSGETRAKNLLIAVSSHWAGRDGFLLDSSPFPATIYDYYGFPEDYYRVRYQPPGAPEMATAANPPARATPRGLDHGHWVPLVFLAPAGDIPVLGVSSSTADPQVQRRFGAEL